MSRIGNSIIKIPEGVTIDFNSGLFTAKGKLGELLLNIDSNINIDISEQEIKLTRKGDSNEIKSMHGLTRALIFNMVKGVDESRANELSPASWIAWNRYSTGEDTSSDWQNSIELLNLEVMHAIDKGHCDFKQNKHIIRSDVMDMDEILSICNAIHFEFESNLDEKM